MLFGIQPSWVQSDFWEAASGRPGHWAVASTYYRALTITNSGPVVLIWIGIRHLICTSRMTEAMI